MTTLATITVIRNLFDAAPAHKAGLRVKAMNAIKTQNAKAFINACTEAGVDSLDAISTACKLFPAFQAEIKAQKAAAKAAAEAKAKASKEAIAKALPLAIEELKALVPAKQRRPRCFKKEVVEVTEAKAEAVVIPAVVEPVVEPVVQAQAFEPEAVPATKVLAPVVNAGALATVAVAVGLGPIAPAIAFAGAAGTAMLGEEKGAIAAAAVVAVGGVGALVGGGVIGVLGAVALAPIAAVAVIGGVLGTIRRS